MPFGVCNGPATFQRMSNQVLQGLSAFSMVYIDDIIIFSKDSTTHMDHCDQVFARLDKWNLKIHLGKCHFFKAEVKFLGFFVSGKGIRHNPDKVKAILEWPKPKTTQELRRFLGMCAFYHKFLRSLSSIAAPLYRLTGKMEMKEWDEKADKAFDKLKTRLAELPMLRYPDSNIPYEMHTDASDSGLGAVLVQEGRPVSFASRSLTTAEANYTATEKECLAVVWALRYFRPYIHGASLTIFTDHMALKAIVSSSNPKGRIARWIMELDAYEFTVIHRRGMDNLDADALSRVYSNNQYTLTDDLIRAHQLADQDIQGWSSEEQQGKYRWLQGLFFRINESGTYTLVMPKALCKYFLQLIHSHPTAGHMGRDKTIAKAKQVAWWPTLVQDVTDFIRKCPDCQRHKTLKHKYGYLTSIPVGNPGEVWASDVAIMANVSESGNKYIVVFMEYLTKWVITAELSSFTTTELANILLYRIVLVYGMPAKLITDNGSSYVSEAMNIICDRLGIARSVTSVEHPQTDGLVERMNQTLKTALAPYAYEYPRRWDQFLPFVTFGINTSKQASTGFTPFELMYCRTANLPTTANMKAPPMKAHNAESWLAYLNYHLPIIHATAKKNILAAQARQQRYYNRNRLPAREYQPGDYVLKDIPLEQRGFPKPKFTGKWRVLRKTSDDQAYVLECAVPGRKKKRTTANQSQLEPYYE